MGPYYRETSQGTGAFFELFYQHPLLMLLLVTASLSIAALLWWRNKAR